VAGVDLKNEEVTLGTYPETSKTAIRALIGAGTPLDVQINGTSIINSGTANIPLANDSTIGVIKSNTSYGTGTTSAGILHIVKATDSNIKAANTDYRPIVPST